MLSTIAKGCKYTANFLLSLFSTDTWTMMIVGIVGAALLALMIGGFILHAAAASTNIMIAAAVLAVFAVPLSIGIYFLDKNKPTPSESKNDESGVDYSGFNSAFMANFGLPAPTV